MKSLVILAGFDHLADAYSLVHVVLEQARAALYAEIPTYLVLAKTCPPGQVPEDLTEHPLFTLCCTLPVCKETGPWAMAKALRTLLESLPPGVVICHDLCFQEHFERQAEAIHCLPDIPGWQWYHQIHSGAGQPQPRTGAARFRCSLPPAHRILALNSIEVPRLAAYYGVEQGRISVLQNPRDLAGVLGIEEPARSLLYDSGLLEAEVAMLYPISMTRATAKGALDVARTAAALNRAGAAVRLLYVNAHSTCQEGRKQMALLQEGVTEIGAQSLVGYASDSSGVSSYEGLTNRQVNQLFQATNLFVLSSRAECSPLILLEAALAGCLLVVNREVPGLRDLAEEGAALFYPFGDKGRYQSDAHFDRLAAKILSEMDCRMNRSKRAVLSRHNRVVYAESLKRLLL